MRLARTPAILFVLGLVVMLYMIAPRTPQGSVTKSDLESSSSRREQDEVRRLKATVRELQERAGDLEVQLRSQTARSDSSAHSSPLASHSSFQNELKALQAWEEQRREWAQALMEKDAKAMRRGGSRKERQGGGKFRSEAVEALIQSMRLNLVDSDLSDLFVQCYANTLDTTVTLGEHEGQPDTYVITGDIDAMWLRDSTAQVWPYLSLMRQDEALRRMVEGVVRRQARYVKLDAHANAFFRDGGQRSPWTSDGTQMLAGVHERKYELDSLAAVLRLSVGYFEYSDGDRRPFDDAWLDGVSSAVHTIALHLNPNDESYTFSRHSPMPTETLLQRIGPAGVACGLSKSPFRPSDDASTLPFPIAANAMTAVALRRLIGHGLLDGRPALKEQARDLAKGMAAAVWKHGVVEHGVFGPVFAYEVDGGGSALISDDANVPSLLSLPYLEFVPHNDTVYRNTRRLLHSYYNPWYFRGSVAEGIGSPHAYGYDFIWPMSIIMRAMTSDNDEEIRLCLAMLKNSHADTFFMHESFHKDSPSRFTRHWFAWVNGLFGEMLIKVARERPHLVLKENTSIL